MTFLSLPTFYILIEMLWMFYAIVLRRQEKKGEQRVSCKGLSRMERKCWRRFIIKKVEKWKENLFEKKALLYDLSEFIIPSLFADVFFLFCTFLWSQLFFKVFLFHYSPLKPNENFTKKGCSWTTLTFCFLRFFLICRTLYANVPFLIYSFCSVINKEKLLRAFVVLLMFNCGILCKFYIRFWNFSGWVRKFQGSFLRLKKTKMADKLHLHGLFVFERSKLTLNI
jgi:hypothetical protein